VLAVCPGRARGHHGPARPGPARGSAGGAASARRVAAIRRSWWRRRVARRAIDAPRRAAGRGARTDGFLYFPVFSTPAARASGPSRRAFLCCAAQAACKEQRKYKQKYKRGHRAYRPLVGRNPLDFRAKMAGGGRPGCDKTETGRKKTRKTRKKTRKKPPHTHPPPAPEE